ncbi:hypothetical protein AAW12_11110 [Sphingobacterium sp. Ag1]|nr:hypothetical protein AAW12_11110 [Sphingobacterium sp. Ag1]
MMFLDCMYVVCCNFYKKRDKDIFKTSGLILLSAVFMCNIALVFFILRTKRLFVWSLIEYKYSILIFLFVMISCLYLRYFKITNYEEVNNKLYSINRDKMNLYYLMSTLYIILSFASMIGYAFYKGGQVNRWW